MKARRAGGAPVPGGRRASDRARPVGIFVLGMHRSGTSLLARVLNLLGCELPEDLLGANRSNPTGHWESLRAIEINDALLRELGRSWDDPRELPVDWLQRPETEAAREQVRAFLDSEFAGKPLWLVKEPRLCRLAPLWLDVAQSLGVDTRVIVPLRHPSEVAYSLSRRDGIDPGRGYLLWWQHLVEAERASRERPRSLSSFDGLLADWRAETRRIGAELGIAWPVDADAVAAEIATFIDPRLLHADVDDKRGALLERLPPPPPLAGLHAGLAARDGDPWSRIAATAAEIDPAASLYGPALEDAARRLSASDARTPDAGFTTLAEALLARAEETAPMLAGIAATLGSTLARFDVGDRERARLLQAIEAMASRMDQSEPISIELVRLVESGRQESLRARAELLEAASGLHPRMEGLSQLALELVRQVEAQRAESGQALSALASGLVGQGPVLAEVVRQVEAQRREATRDAAQLASAQRDAAATLAAEAARLRESLAGAAADDAERLRRELADAIAAASAQTSRRVAEAVAEAAAQSSRALAEALEAQASRARLEQDRALEIERAERARVVAERDRIEAERRRLVAQQGLAAEERDRLARERDVLARRAEQDANRLADLAQAVAAAEAGWAAAAADLEHAKDLLGAARADADELRRSTSWRLTAPLRAVRRAFTPRPAAPAPAPTGLPGPGLAKRLYLALPVPWSLRLRAKSAIFLAFGPLLRRTDAYRRWQMQRTQRPGMQLPAALPPFVPPARSSAPAPARQYVPIAQDAVLASELRAKLIAFYLPQFHPIPENDEWWGRGFTEWTNVSKALPQFDGHEQPHLPGELGFYDLRLPEVMHRQIELAKQYGVHGFCFHYYWFDGRRILERPLNQFLADPSFDLPFCICWANENWTRRWDGHDDDVLLGQKHSPDSDLRFIRDVEPLLRDPRYIRVGGRPLLVVYRPSLLPDCAATVERWRAHCRASGLGEIVLAMVQFDVQDPRPFGFDVALEFPPHKLARDLPSINATLPALNPAFKGYVVDYQAVVERSLHWPVPEYDMIRGVFPGWDNEARKPQQGYLFAHASPSRYRDWLGAMVDYARAHPVRGEPLVFVNAWNEWAEGAYLEPDRRNGYAYLQATRDALTGVDAASRPQPVAALPAPAAATGDAPARPRIVVVSHDAHPHGAQYLSLNLCRELRAQGWDVDAILLGTGVLEEEFAKTADLHFLSCQGRSEDAVALAARLRAGGAEIAIANTAVSGLLVPPLRQAGLRVVSLIHELPGVLADYGLQEHAQRIAEQANRVVFAAQAVREGFEVFADLPPSKALIRPQGLYKRNRMQSDAAILAARADVRQRLGIPADAKLVLGVGYADLRKGVDLFVQIGERLVREDPGVHLAWLGHFDLELEPRLRKQVERTGLAGHFHFPGRESDTDPWYAAADVYALTSREDPFPSVVMEAFDARVPVIGFASAGGFEELLLRGGGLLAPGFDVDAFADRCAALLGDETRRRRLGEEGKGLVEAEFDFGQYVRELIAASDAQTAPARAPRISVVVPNYNYARFLEARLASVAGQTLAPHEIIVLDDASTDGSLAELERLRERFDFQLIANDANSGSVCRQWLRGVQAATGDLVWIAEADDLSEPGFLAAVAQAFERPDVVMSYCQSRQVGAQGEELAPDYLDYVADFGAERWRAPFVASLGEELERGLAVKNTIPNVSAVLFQRDALAATLETHLDEIASYRIAGDWVTYLRLLEGGRLAFVPDALNLHRRHAGGVTLGTDNRPHMAEIERVQDGIRARVLLTPETQAAVDAYRSFLLGYFGLDREPSPA